MLTLIDLHFAYYDQTLEQQERNTFHKRLYDLMARLKAINKMGKFILLYLGEFSWDECLSLYREEILARLKWPV